MKSFWIIFAFVSGAFLQAKFQHLHLPGIVLVISGVVIIRKY